MQFYVNFSVKQVEIEESRHTRDTRKMLKATAIRVEGAAPVEFATEMKSTDVKVR